MSLPASLPILASAHGLGGAAEKVGVIAVALLAGVFVLGPGRLSERARAAGVLGAVALTPVLLVADIWNTSQLRQLRHHPLEAGAAVVIALAVVALLVVVVRRRPQSLPLMAVAAVPFRLPISTGGATPSNLLIPLYLVVGGGAVAYAVPRLWGSRARAPAHEPGLQAPGGDRAADGGGGGVDDQAIDDRADRPGVAQESAPGPLELVLIGSVVLYALQAVYSSDFSKALENVVFFYVPFALLFGLLRRVHWTRELLLTCLGIVVVEAVLFTGVGFVEYGRKHLLLNPKVVQSNEYGNYFRVNSLFFDPSIYGRFLSLVMLLVATVVLWTRRRRVVLAGGVVLLWLIGGLITSFSQSSIAALLLGLAVLAAWRWTLRETVLVGVMVAAVGLLVLLFAPSGSHLGISGSSSADNATSGRASLISNGISLFTDRPLQGFGPGAFSTEYVKHNARAAQNDATSASHAIPITVAAEQGVLGLAVYLALLVAAFGRLFGGASPSPERIAVAACFAALVLHTLVYADFLEDPIAWALMAVGAALAAGPRGSAAALRRRGWRRPTAGRAGAATPSGAAPA